MFLHKRNLKFISQIFFMKKGNFYFCILTFIALFFTKNTCCQQLKYKQHYKIIKSGKIVFDFTTDGIRDTIFQYRTKGKDTLVEKTVLKLWYSKPSTFQVRINPYLYDVTVKARQVNDEGIVDSMASRLFLGALTTLSENKKILDTVVKKSQEGTDVPKPKSADSVGAKIAETINLDNIQKSIVVKQVAKLTDAANIAESVDKDSLVRRIKIEAGLSSIQSNNLKAGLEEVVTEKIIFDTYKMKRQVFIKNLEAFLDSARRLEDEYDICEYSALLCLMDKQDRQVILDSIQSYVRTEGRDSLLHLYMNKLPGYLSYYKRQIDSCYRQVRYSYNELSETARPLKYFNLNYKFDSLLKDNNDTLYLSYNRIKPEVFVKGVTLMIRNLQNPRSFYHTCPPVLLTKDSLIYNVEIKPSERFKYFIDKYGIKTYSVGKFDYPVPVKGNFKVNFSVGAAFMHKELRPKQYFFSTPLENLGNDGDTVFIRKKESSDAFIPAITAFTHGYVKFGGWFTPAISVGLSTNPTDFSNASYFLGLSLICGHQSRLIFTFGRAGSSVSVLKGKYEVDKIYTKKDFLNIQESDLTKKGFQRGWFWGVSYNISSNR